MAEPRVGFDATSLGALGKGVARYARELLPELARLDAPVSTVVLAPHGAALPVGAEGLPTARVSARPAIAWEQLRVRTVVRKERLSLLHTTTDRLPLRARVPLVVYLFEDPKYRLEALRGSRGPKKAVADALTAALFPRSMRTAALVLVSSEATARDLEARGVPAERVRLVYPGVSSAFRPGDADERAAIRQRLAAPDGYVLHFSSDDPRDNTPGAFEAYAELCRRLPHAPPLLVPGPVVAELEAQRALATSFGILEQVRWLGFQSGDDLAELYRGASVYVDPSLYEGFGFQVAEALASGVPVACSNVTSLPEVVGDAGILVAPRDVRGFADALEQALTDEEFAAGLRARAGRQARRFSWARAARETVDAWLELL